MSKNLYFQFIQAAVGLFLYFSIMSTIHAGLQDRKKMCFLIFITFYMLEENSRDTCCYSVQELLSQLVSKLLVMLIFDVDV